MPPTRNTPASNQIESKPALAPSRWRALIFSDLGVLLLLAAARVLLHALTNGQYGFHRDELATLAEARHLDWGFVAYPPLTPLIAAIAVALFGPSTVGLRLFSSAAQAAGMVLTGLMARELGGGRRAQVVAAVAAAIAPLSLAQGALFQYVAFDYLWWVLIAYCLIRLLKDDEPRWWLGIGAAAGLGLQTRYTIGFYLLALAVAVLLTPARRYLRSRWLWAGAGLALLIFLPNLIWQAQHGFISLRFLATIHERDVNIGRADNFLLGQFIVSTNLFTAPLWIAGLWWYLFSPAGRRYRLLGWLAVLTVGLLMASRGREYYTAAAYPMLFAAGAAWGDGWLHGLRPWRARGILAGTYTALALGGLAMAAIMLPVWPINSPMFRTASGINSDIKEEIGWPQLAQEVADIYQALPAAQRAHTAIVADNYGEAGAIDLYGPALGLPPSISGVNTYWLRGYGNPPPQTLVVVGLSDDTANRLFTSCRLAGHIPNPYHLNNEESHVPDIFVCGPPRQPWPEFWRNFQHFG
jgi:hypothetical protein